MEPGKGAAVSKRAATKGAATKDERKIVVYIATSADGFIARSDGSVDWLNRPRTAGDYGMGAFFRSIDTILLGRKTYDKALEMGGGGGGFGAEKVKSYVFSHGSPKSPPSGTEFVNEPIAAFARRLRGEPGKRIWLMGGGGLIASFLDEGEIDEFVIHLIPTFIGAGIPLIQPARRTVALGLRSVRRYSDGVVRLHYDVTRKAATKGKARKRTTRR